MIYMHALKVGGDAARNPVICLGSTYPYTGEPTVRAHHVSVDRFAATHPRNRPGRSTVTPLRIAQCALVSGHYER